MRFSPIVAFLTIFLIACSDSEEPTNVEPEKKTTTEETVEETEQPENPEDLILVMDSIFPQLVDLGDTLSLRGENFKRDIRLSLGQRQLEIFFNNDSLVEFGIPYWGFEPDSLHIKVDNRDTIAEFKNAFQLYPPEIDSIPSNFGFKDTVVVYGKHLTNHPPAKDGIIELNNTRIDVTHQNKDSIRFVLPYNVYKHENDLLVRAQLREIVKDRSVVIPNPVITGISKDSVIVGEAITIYGSNFYPDVTSYNQILIDGKQTEVLKAYSDSLVFRMPLGPYKGREIGKITVKVLEKEIDANLKLFLKNKWYLYDFKRNREISNTAGVGQISRQSFYYNNAFYFSVYDYIVVDGLNSGLNYRLHKYSPENSSWEQQLDIPVFSEGNIRGESIQIFPIENGELYIYVNRELDNFYRYNFITGNLVKLHGFDTGYKLGDAVGFIQNDHFYIGAGYASVGSGSYTQNSKFWKYSKVNDSWIEISEIPDVPGKYEYAYYSNYFKKDNKVYICNGDKAYETWEFTPDETWVRKSDLENPVSQTVFTQIGDKGFFYHYGDRLFYEYDITNDKWSRREDLKVGGYYPGKETMFEHEGYVYLVGYLNGYPPEYNGFSRYDHLILRTELSNFID